MEGAQRSEQSKEEVPPSPLQIDPNCIQDALRAFLPPIRHDDPHQDFYAIYKREATEYDADYVKKYDEDLNTTLIFAGLFSAVSSAFVIDVHSQLQPDPNDQSAALLRAILLTLNQSAVPGETPTVPPTQKTPPSEIVTVTCLMYASLLISLLAAFIAMLGKQWLNRYLRHAGGSTIERCGDRQRKCDGLKRWPFRFFIESLPVMLQIALLFLACGLCRHMWSINDSVAGVLIALTILGVLFYLGIIIAGASSYECPFQTPVSLALHSSWKKTGPHVTAALRPVVVVGTSLYRDLPWSLALTLLHRLWEAIQCQTLRILLRFPLIDMHHRSRTSLPIAQPAPQEPAPRPNPLHSLWESIKCKILRIPPRPPHTFTPSTVREGSPDASDASPWLTPTTLDTLRKANANDTRCVSWILWNITDPEALDTAIRLAGAVRWFENGTDIKPPYDLVISTLEAYFDSTGNLYPGLEDRAYYSARAILWIRIRAMCVSEKFAQNFPPPPYTRCPITDLSSVLGRLLDTIYSGREAYTIFRLLRDIPQQNSTPVHSQWASNALLHLSWAKRGIPNTFSLIRRGDWGSGTIPMNSMLNRLLAFCIFLGWPVEEEVLMIQDKSDRMEQILSQLSQAIVSAIRASNSQRDLLPDALYNLTKWKNRPSRLTEMAYGWCSVICENYSNLTDERFLLPYSLEVGFGHLGLENLQGMGELTHTAHHRKMIDIIFDEMNPQGITNLLLALILSCRFAGKDYDEGVAESLMNLDTLRQPPNPYASLRMCTGHLVGLSDWHIHYSRTQTIIHAIELIGYRRFERVGLEGMVALLNGLDVSFEDVQRAWEWKELLPAIIKSSSGIPPLSLQWWKLLVEIAIREPLLVDAYPTHVMASLERAGEWDKLVCWLGVVWSSWPPETGKTTEEELEHAMQSLSRQRPDTIQELEQWVEQWSSNWGWLWLNGASTSFRRICEQVRLKETSQATLQTLLTDRGAEWTLPDSLSPILPLSLAHDDTY